MKIAQGTMDGMICNVVFSDDERHRLDVVWTWDEGPILCFCLLNPSTLDHRQNDPTGRGVVARARKWGFGGARIVNEFTLRTPTPSVMLKEGMPNVPGADEYLRGAMIGQMQTGAPFIMGAGRHGSHRGRDREIHAMAEFLGCPLWCLVQNDDGTPKHPLYIAHEIKPKPWSPA